MNRYLVKILCTFSIGISLAFPVQAQDQDYCPYFFDGNCCPGEPCMVPDQGYCQKGYYQEAPCSEPSEWYYGKILGIRTIALGAVAGAVAGWATCKRHKKHKDVCCSPIVNDKGQTLAFNFDLMFQASNPTTMNKSFEITPYVMEPDGHIVYGEKVCKTVPCVGSNCVQICDHIFIDCPIFGTYHLGYILATDDAGWIVTCPCTESITVYSSRYSTKTDLIFTLQPLITDFFQEPHQQIEVTEFVYPKKQPDACPDVCHCKSNPCY